MNKPELVNAIAEKTGLNKKDSERAVNAFVESISEALARGDKVSLVGFGTFEVRTRQARTGRNPRTGQTLTIPAAKVPAFKPGKQLRDMVK
ncbi:MULTISPECIES: HU family DNA-binding protein [Thermaerobacter]|uniref:Bacterial nucleoid DNA-binding protein n=1 Tax=Thermaerobacter subterraneus DSM 13965 TaxID=867903 RepID=K6PP77_9FIRM|nr:MULTISPECIES: HU family DNA-binding protein [Thermaerobacter]EKP94717.1 bacterial nucleoid DNA-binding protein [Thermaerobacter subterraneus DSM 13965]QIA26176.1 HU family DNA-binding protein [Thermaerobacter sp. PB12/4term]